MTGRNLASRIAKIEGAKGARPAQQYVYHVSEPPTAEEQEAIDNASGPIIIMPHPCATTDEWVAQNSPTETSQ